MLGALVQKLEGAAPCSAVPGRRGGHLTFPLDLFFSKQWAGLQSCGLSVSHPFPSYHLFLIFLHDVRPEACFWVQHISPARPSRTEAAQIPGP